MTSDRSLTLGPGAGAPAAAGTSAPPRALGRRVVDAPMRMFHALFGLTFVGAYLTADGEAWRALHLALGYALFGLLGFRIGYGLWGPQPYRFAVMGRKIGAAWRWLRGLLRPGALRSAAAWRPAPQMLLAIALAGLLALSLPLVLSGIGADFEVGEALWGDAPGELHEFFGNLMLMLVLAHLALLALASWRARRNLAAPMLSGRAPSPGADLVRNRAGLAIALLAAVLAWGAWRWQQAPNGLLPGSVAEALQGDHHGDRDHDDD